MFYRIFIIAIFFLGSNCMIAQRLNKNIDMQMGTDLRSKAKNEYTLLEELKKHTTNRRDSLSRIYKMYFDQIKATNDTLLKKNLNKKVYELDKLTDENNSKELQIEFDFVQSHPSSYLALDVLRSKMHRREGINQYNTFNYLYHSLDLQIQNSEKGREMRKELDNFKNSAIGSIAPDLTIKDVNNNPLTLSMFRNEKYILIDFWASWCAPCRQDFPFLKEMYNKYHEKGFEIISVSRDKDLESWRSTILKDNVGIWRHFSTVENNSTIEDSYFVSAIPQKILINKEGIIIGRWKGGGDENQVEMKKIFAETFDK